MPVKKKAKTKKLNFLSFQEIIMNLQNFWGKNGCVILQPYDMEVGAGTFHPATTLRSLGTKPWKAAYVQPSRRPTDGRYGENPNRLQHYYQYQVIIKPSPKNIKQLYLRSLSTIGIDVKNHDIRFVEDDWESPTLGASGLGWEVWCDGMEITQFTYFQQMTGIECKPVPVEITYGLERLCMFVQGKNKSTLDPFVDEKEEDVKRLKNIQLELHADFIKVVETSRGSKLKDPEKNNIFTGEFWTGKTALGLGLIDGIGNADQVLKEKFGDKVIIKNFEKPKGFIARKLSSSIQDPVERISNIIEEKSMWQKFGL